MNADPTVMEHFPSTLSVTESAAMVERIEACFSENGYGLWAVELLGEAPFIGFVGLSPVDDHFDFAPAVEVGWRLARPFWGRGLAAEAARAAMGVGFGKFHLGETVSFTAKRNARSWRVMQRLGMQRDPDDDFAHPLLPENHVLRDHVLYRIDRKRWRAASSR